jgi:glucose/arabinose dehydrogenase
MKVKFISLLTVFLVSVFLLISCKQTAVIQSVSIETTSGVTAMTTPAQSSEGNTTTSGETTAATGSQGFHFPIAIDVENRFTIQDAFPGLKFKRPLDFQNAGDGSGRVFIVEQGGQIYVIETTPGVKDELFLDISNRIDNSGNEMGLLGLAFHPSFKENGLFFVNYTNSTSTVISKFKTDPSNPNRADPLSEEIILTFTQPYSNHNGGQLAFSPNDGYLYIGVGDGGSAGDPNGNGQNCSTLLGKILRIDINKKDPGLNYGIPPDNPFVNNSQGKREEIYAYGLRNPWRFSFDPQSGRLWAADVGQDKVEEIDLIEKGKNYGWNIMEGSLCYNPSSGCNTSGLELPVYEYQHPLGDAVTGGYVYSGQKLPVLNRAYIYGDYGTGLIWGLWYQEGNKPQNFTLANTKLNISSFGIDEDNELYLTSFDGKIYNLKPVP